MSEPVLIPVIYKCGHTINLLSPGVSDPLGILAGKYEGTPLPVPATWDDKCWNCGDRFKTVVPPEVTEALRLAKKGEKVI